MKFKDKIKVKIYDIFFSRIDKTVNAIYWANVFNSTIANSTWFQNRSISPGRWAVGYAFLYALYRVLDEKKPNNILEFGLGQSSKMTIQYQKNNPLTKLKIWEHDQNWINHFQNNFSLSLDEYLILDNLSHKKINEHESFTYEHISIMLKSKYDLVILDGPFGSPHYSRPELLDLIKLDGLEQDFIVLIDDYNRLGERETVELFEDLLHKKNIQYCKGIYSGRKDCCIVTSINNKFFTTL